MSANERPRDSLHRAATAPSGRKEQPLGFEQRLAPEDEGPRTRAGSTRDLKITLKDLEEYGYTEVGCRRCGHIKEHGHGRECPYARSGICRERIKKTLAETPKGRERLWELDQRRRGVQEPLGGEQGPARELVAREPQAERPRSMLREEDRERARAEVRDMAIPDPDEDDDMDMDRAVTDQVQASTPNHTPPPNRARIDCHIGRGSSCGPQKCDTLVWLQVLHKECL